MNVLIMHQSFPGQYRHLAAAVMARGDRVVAIGSPTAQPLEGVALHRYNPLPAGGVPACHGWVAGVQTKALRAEAVAARIKTLRSEGLAVDLVIGHPGWGELLDTKDVLRGVPVLQQRRPQARMVIVGEEGVSYGTPPPGGGSWKQVMLQEFTGRLELSRIHFVGRMPHPVLHELFRICACHVYLTYPFVLSWSLLEAMACGAVVIGSATAPAA